MSENKTADLVRFEIKCRECNLKTCRMRFAKERERER